MKQTKKISSLLIFCLLLLFSIQLIAQSTPSSYKIIFYNVENLFDTEDDPEKRDNEFLPNGDRFWNKRKYYTKLNRIFQVVMAASQGTQPAIIGVCEIENRTVLEDLLHFTPLGKMGYKIIHKESPDRRGIDVALLYNKNLFEPIAFDAFPVKNPKDEGFKTRDILYTKGKIGNDSLHIFINHWPSKYGGVIETKPLRALAANVLRNKYDSLFAENPNVKAIAIGDFNDSPFDESVTNHLKAVTKPNKKKAPQIINLSYKAAKKGEGTNKFHGKWELIDQVFVSSGLLQNQGLTTTMNSFHIFKADFMLEDDKSYLGKKPFRTYMGFKYNNGFSDHLPVIVDLEYKE